MASGGHRLGDRRVGRDRVVLCRKRLRLARRSPPRGTARGARIYFFASFTVPPSPRSAVRAKHARPPCEGEARYRGLVHGAGVVKGRRPAVSPSRRSSSGALPGQSFEEWPYVARSARDRVKLDATQAPPCSSPAVKRRSSVPSSGLAPSAIPIRVRRASARRSRSGQARPDEAPHRLRLRRGSSRWSSPRSPGRAGAPSR